MPEDGNERFVLEGVPRVQFYKEGDRCPEDITFPSCLRACLEYLGHPLGCKLINAHDTVWRLSCGYSYLVATSGVGFKLSWQDGWAQDNIEMSYMSEDPSAPIRKAFESVGFTFQIFHKDAGEAVILDAIMRSLRVKRRPVIAFGVIPPPEACIVTGYDDGGDVLIGWNFFQGMSPFNAGVEEEPTGEFRKRNWFPDTEGIILIGDKVCDPDLHQVLLDTLRWGLKVSRTNYVDFCKRRNGHAAYTAWAEHLLCDDDFPAGDMDILRLRLEVHDDAVGTLAECRWYTSEFLKMMAEREPAMADELLAAARCYSAEHDLMWEAWGQVGGLGRDDEKARKLAEPKNRRAIAGFINRAREHDITACNHLERALQLGAIEAPAQ